MSVKTNAHIKKKRKEKKVKWIAFINSEKTGQIFAYFCYI